jgi:hypothetical protein
MRNGKKQQIVKSPPNRQTDGGRERRRINKQ